MGCYTLFQPEQLANVVPVGADPRVRPRAGNARPYKNNSLFSTEGQAVKAERPKNQNRIIEYRSLTKVTVLGASSVNRSEATNNFQLSTFNFQLKNGR